MASYESDVLIIPVKYKNMSIPELECEKIELLQEINSVERQKKNNQTEPKQYCL